MNERTFQGKAIRWLRDQGAYVVKNRAGPGVPNGTPDVFAFYGPHYTAIEFKTSATATYRPGQEAALNFLRRGTADGRLGGRFVYTAFPENWPDIQADLLKNFF